MSRALNHVRRQSAAVKTASSVNVPEQLRQEWPSTGVNQSALQKIIDHDNHEMRAKFREYLKRPEFKPKYAISLNEERELALERLQQVSFVLTRQHRFVSL